MWLPAVLLLVMLAEVIRGVLGLQCFVCGDLARRTYAKVIPNIEVVCDQHITAEQTDVPLFTCQAGVNCAQKSFGLRVTARVCADDDVCEQFAGGTERHCKRHPDGTVVCCCNSNGCNGVFLPASVWPAVWNPNRGIWVAPLKSQNNRNKNDSDVVGQDWTGDDNVSNNQIRSYECEVLRYFAVAIFATALLLVVFYRFVCM